ncbi:hypothetical protein OC846_001305 [Tilletia horrida]|uniref:Acetyl-coenzyme A transporter 1 n=1 Tax=Tilletia horrida TaxID=155126 RepID=A0AAN6JT43_9BASI|nr:hypothetical protein OC845_001241 [Tilletia horrida]KAK0556211.1 hypothetical protein OC846_001305 [Tilletia horrida]KAK0569126.1 hypothetical protein OC861_001266 [Tilletia horrida]
MANSTAKDSTGADGLRQRSAAPAAAPGSDAPTQPLSHAHAHTAGLTSPNAGGAMGLTAPPNGLSDGEKHHVASGSSSAGLSLQDKKAIALLVVLYLLQGVPVGLAFGTMPYLLKSRVSYSDVGTFAFSTWPYSLKLLWSPIVDSLFVESLTVPILGTKISMGRRKSWIVPFQLIIGLMMYYLGSNVDQLLLTDHPDVNLITLLFFLLVLFAATQDIAVDGWALTLLSQESVGYASTAQTFGLNTGYFLSFTVFLAFNSVEFSNKYFRSEPLDYPLVSLGGYMKFWAFGFLIVTTWLTFFKKEDPDNESDDMGVKGVYDIMWKIMKLKHVRSFIIVHLVSKIGFQANEAVTGLKLVEKGFGKEDFALTVLVDFPFQLLFGYLAARWSQGSNALRPWIWAFFGRLAFAVISMAMVAYVPASPIPLSYFALIILITVASGFAQTVQFVGITAFHTQIADPVIGGTYMTLLNTVSNMGGTWPRSFVLKAVDLLTVATCEAPSSLKGTIPADFFNVPASQRECVTDAGKALCDSAGGQCVTERDGYYATSSVCVGIGFILLVGYIIPVCRRLQALPVKEWRVATGAAAAAGAIAAKEGKAN